jgi:hypothetical protein
VGVDEVAAYVRDRLGMDPQAVARARRGVPAGWAGRVWDVMTERGNFWLVEDGAAVELFLAFAPTGPTSPTARYPTPARAVARFLELHPADPDAATRAPPTDDAPIRLTCHSCGVEVSSIRPPAAVERLLCTRCRRAERGRERYRTDPEYRARCLAKSAAYGRRVRRENPT